jgi:hypothetical protein
MKFEEALKLLREGKALQRKSIPNTYFEMWPTSDFDILSFSMADVLADDWQVFKSPRRRMKELDDE